MSFIVKIEDGAGTRYATTNRALHWRSVSRRDRAGEFSFTIPATAAEADTMTVRRIARCYAEMGGTLVEVGAGIIDKRELVGSYDEQDIIELSGNDLLYGLTNKTCLLYTSPSPRD